MNYRTLYATPFTQSSRSLILWERYTTSNSAPGSAVWPNTKTPPNLHSWQSKKSATSSTVRPIPLIQLAHSNLLLGAVPVNLKDEDKFHLTIEEYLLSLISMVEELSRLAVNSVTLGDYHRPLEINNFIKDLFAGFQLLNLKNDILRKRSDGIKYSVRSLPPSSGAWLTKGTGQKSGGRGLRSLLEESDSQGMICMIYPKMVYVKRTDRRIVMKLILMATSFSDITYCNLVSSIEHTT